MPIQIAADSINNSVGSPYGFKNRIINGAMVIDQRNAGASYTAPNGDAYNLDRFITYNSVTSKYTVQRNAGSVTPPPGFTNYLGVTSSSAYSVPSGELYILYQTIEGYNLADLDWGKTTAKKCTLSFWVRSSLTGTFGGSFLNQAQNRGYAFSYTINSANTWEYKTITVAGDTTGTWLTDNGRGLIVSWSLGVGSTFTFAPNSWGANQAFTATGSTSVVGTSGATFYITGVQFEVGSQATAFDYRDYTTELQLCQRYYEIITSQNGTTSLVSFYNTATQYGINPIFKVTKRVAPTFGLGAGASWAVATPGTFNLSIDCAYIYSTTSFFYITAPVGNTACYFNAEL